MLSDTEGYFDSGLPFCLHLFVLSPDRTVADGLLFLGPKHAAALFKPCYFLLFCAADGPSKAVALCCIRQRTRILARPSRFSICNFTAKSQNMLVLRNLATAKGV